MYIAWLSFMNTHLELNMHECSYAFLAALTVNSLYVIALVSISRKLYV